MRTSLLSPVGWSQCEKYIECCFGILKKRFAILKNAIRVHDIQQISAIVKTCVILHNFLIEHANDDGTPDDDGELEWCNSQHCRSPSRSWNTMCHCQRQ